jgi:hypothetical protein
MVDDTPRYWTAMLPGLLLMGVSAGPSLAPMFAAANTLPADRATTGTAVINMSRQVGTAIGVAILVALTAGAAPAIGYPRAWTMQAVTGILVALILLFSAVVTARRSRSATAPERYRA